MEVEFILEGRIIMLPLYLGIQERGWIKKQLLVSVLFFSSSSFTVMAEVWVLFREKGPAVSQVN